MPWTAIAVNDVLAEFTPGEQSALNNVQGAGGTLAAILTRVVKEFIGAMAAANFNVNTDGTVPDQLRGHIIARARWGWLISFPELEELQTKGRQAAADAAARMLEKISQRQAGAIEDPAGTTPSANNWNSENKIITRTHPVPPASVQSPPSEISPPYANPDAPADN